MTQANVNIQCIVRLVSKYIPHGMPQRMKEWTEGLLGVCVFMS